MTCDAGNRATALAPALLVWFERSGRKHLPWQQNRTAYRVWVSEIMLQQTQVATVIPYYLAFMKRFPDIAALAGAPVDEVLHLWSGLGYYARARNLQRAAQTIVHLHGGEFPVDFEKVEALPGIGRSTAGAILALSQNQRHAILDGNVKRVLARYFGVEGFPGEPAVAKVLWEYAEVATPATRVDDYTQAIMDLGATVCVRSRPQCLLCPLSENCVARMEGRQSLLPTPRPKKARPQRHAHIVVALRRDGAILLERRPPAGIWGGLWSFPEFVDLAAASTWIGATLGVSPEGGTVLGAYDHGFSHFDLRLHPVLVRTGEHEPVPESGPGAGLTAVSGLAPIPGVGPATEGLRQASRVLPTGAAGRGLTGSIGISEAREQLWYQPKEPSRIGLAAPVATLIGSLAKVEFDLE